MRISLILDRRRPSPELVAVATVLAVLAAAACGTDATTGGDGRPLVVTGFYPLAEAAVRVGGDAVRVENLTPPGVEPHDLELSPRQVELIGGADLIVYLGGGFQPAVEVAADEADGVEVDALSAVSVGEEGAGPRDPHVWLDPTLQAAIGEAIAEQLADLVPEEATSFAENAEAYRAELEELDAEYRERLAGCEGAVLVTSHEAFGYLAERYGLREAAIAGVSGETEPTPERLAELVDVVREEGVSTVFTEPLAPAEIAETLAREAGVSTAVLDPIEGLTAEQEEAGVDYRSVMRSNLEALEEGLRCG